MISIYMSVVLALAFLYESRLPTKGILFGLILFLGSSTGLAALLAGVAAKWLKSKNRISPLRVVVFSVPLCALLFLPYYYTLTYRDRDLLNLESLDRYQLAYAGVFYILETITLDKFLFGYGVGSDLTGIFNFFPVNASVLFWVQNSRAIDGFTGLVFHNEFLRVFVNFGLIGSVLIWGSLMKFLTTPSLKWAILAASLLNSTVYITPIFIFLLISEMICRSRRREMLD